MGEAGERHEAHVVLEDYTACRPCAVSVGKVVHGTGVCAVARRNDDALFGAFCGDTSNEKPSP